MYFSDEEHKDNYYALMGLYGYLPNEDVQYEASIYIAAYPEIYKAFDLDLLKDQKKEIGSISPLFFLKNDDYNAGHETGALTGTTYALVEAGLSLYNGYLIGLDDLFGSIGSSHEGLSVFIEACNIRLKGKLKTGVNEF